MILRSTTVGSVSETFVLPSFFPGTVLDYLIKKHSSLAERTFNSLAEECGSGLATSAAIKIPLE